MGDENKIEFILPVKTVSEANCFEPWRKKHARHKIQKRAVASAMIESRYNKDTGEVRDIKMPCTVRMTRFAPRYLDEQDNLRISLKYVLDSICAEITQDFRPGRADGKPGFTFQYAQEKSKIYSVKVEITYG